MSVDLEAAADALLRDADDTERPVLNARQLRRRQQREVSLETETGEGLRLADVLATNAADPAALAAEWSVLDSLIATAGLTGEERTVLVAGKCYQHDDFEIGRMIGCDRRTVIRRRKAALEKLERVREAGTGSESPRPRR